MSRAVLKLENVNKHYLQAGQKLEILHEANFTLETGKIVAVTGPSGSGKSTFLQICGLLDRIDSGAVIIDNINCAKASDNEKSAIRLSKIGFVYQFHHLLPEFTALENVMMPLIIAGSDSMVAKNKARVLLARLGLEKRENHFPSQLSGGEQQRVAIARSLVQDPCILLADEPTGNLDQHTAGMVFDLFMQVVREQNIACLFVTHNLELAAKADQIYVVRDGVVGLSG